ncbi:hypothetical protein NLJ89_g2912 [Agrocybe chaxingu]|uniref:Rad60/SUMO-like domain-containing protein n=1 Tax=Agrocybe chaxingu TaxID=84603 RepID=A0A9W8MYJ2_9AGAR|nr:hypothetical protein NLJ89_g2912 [Agrocybe chaxingu]
MADSITARPRPRPRPRPVAKASSSTNVVQSATPATAGAGSSTNAITAPTGRVIMVEDTDEMFMRNRNRTEKTWQKLEQLNKKIKVKDDTTDSDDDERSPRRKQKKQRREPSAVPQWQKSKNIARMLSQDLSESSDDEVEITGESSTPNGKRFGKRKRRSRSRSITPPPALPQHQIQSAKDLVRRTLQAAARPPSPTVIDLDPDESTDTFILQPELNALAQEIAEQARRASSQAPEVTSGDEVVITVKWQPHPLDTNGRKEEWKYQMERTDNFRDLFEATAEDAGILSTNLIMTYQRSRIFPSVTPQTLRIWADSAEFMAYEKTAFDYIQRNNVPARPQNVDPIPSTSNDTVEIGSDSDSDVQELPADSQLTQPVQSQQQESESEAEEADQGEKFKLILRSGITSGKDITLVVRPTTKCGAIVKAFLKKAGLAEQYPEVFTDAVAPAPAITAKGKKGGKKSKAAAATAVLPSKDPRLCIDGDKMNNDMEIGDADLEDGDMVEVVGL